MTRIQNHDDDDASSRKRLSMTCGNGDSATWSDLNHDMLFSIMERLEITDISSFSRVCKSWRSLVLSNRNSFMASFPPMSMWISNENECCHLHDFQGKEFITILPHSAGRNYFGLTCGYLILFGKETNDFWLVNPITGHQLHFPNFPITPENLKAILVFSTSLSGWVLVMANRRANEIWFSIAGKGAWNHVFSSIPVLDLHFFKGKIYVLNNYYHLFEMRLNPEPKLMLLETKNFPDQCLLPEFVSAGENLCLMQFISRGLFVVNELDFGKMTWVSSKETREEYAFFHSNLRNIVAINPDMWANPRLQYRNYVESDQRRKGRLMDAKMWYFPHDCLNANVVHE